MTQDRSIAGYQIERLIGEGFIGPVYLVQRDRQYWAMRVVNDTHARLRKTAGLVTNYELHRHLVVYHENGTDSRGRSFLVTDYCSSGSLNRLRVKELGGPIHRFRMLKQIVQGLARLHWAGGVHGMLKASNVLMRGGGSRQQGLVTDVGLSYVFRPDNQDHLTQHVFPTMPPELIEAYLEGDPKIVDAALTTQVDVYAMGQLFCEVMSGRYLFADCENLADLRKRKRTVDFRLASADDIHDQTFDMERLGEVVRTATDPNPTHRFEDLQAFAEEILACQRESDVS